MDSMVEELRYSSIRDSISNKPFGELEVVSVLEWEPWIEVGGFKVEGLVFFGNIW